MKEPNVITNRIYNKEVVFIEAQPEIGGFTGYFVEYPGIIAEGEDFEITKENLKGAYNYMLKWALEDTENFIDTSDEHEILKNFLKP